MPTYVYRFIDTDETIEVVQSFSDPALTMAEHPATGELRPVKKVYLPVGVTFKGGGFYKTDSRSGSGAGSSGSKPADGSAGKSDSSSAKPESSSDSSSGSSSSGKPTSESSPASAKSPSAASSSPA